MLPTIYQIEEDTQKSSPYFFARNTLRFFGQTMSRFTVFEKDGEIFISAPIKIDGEFAYQINDNRDKIQMQTLRKYIPGKNPGEGKLEIVAGDD